MTPISFDRTTVTVKSGTFTFSEMAARKPALPPPRTRIRWIIGCPPRKERPLSLRRARGLAAPARRRCRRFRDPSAGLLKDFPQLGRAEHLVEDADVHARSRPGRRAGKPITVPGVGRSAGGRGPPHQANRRHRAGEAPCRTAALDRLADRCGLDGGAVGP